MWSNERELMIDRIEAHVFLFKDKASDKKDFLLAIAKDKKIPVRTTRLYYIVLNKVDTLEWENKKDWCNFTDEQIDSAYLSFGATSSNTLNSYTTIIKDYLVATTQRSTTILTGFDAMLKMTPKRLDSYIDKAAQDMRFITPEEFDSMIFDCFIDAMVKSVYIFLYHGIKGVGFKEIINMQIEDIDFQMGTIHVDGKPPIKIEGKYLEILEEAIRGTVLTKYNRDGEIISMTELFERESYTRGDFFVRPRYKSTDSIEINKNYLLHIMAYIKSSVDNPHINGQTVYSSGEAWRLIAYVGYRMPTFTEYTQFKEETGSNIAQATYKASCPIILKRMGLLEESEVK